MTPTSGPHPDPLDPWQNLEPAAVGSGVALNRIELAAALSSAMSLKRIADALAGDERHCGLVEALYDVAKRP